jgi:hypothetical protein
MLLGRKRSRRLVPAIVGLLAVMGQPLVAHLHGPQPADGAEVAASVVARGYAGPVVEEHPTTAADADHDRQACPVCQALAHSRVDVSTSRVRIAAPTLAPGICVADVVGAPRDPGAATRAPRAPPRLPS